MRKLFVFLCVAALLAAACSGGDEEDVKAELQELEARLALLEASVRTLVEVATKDLEIDSLTAREVSIVTAGGREVISLSAVPRIGMLSISDHQGNLRITLIAGDSGGSLNLLDSAGARHAALLVEETAEGTLQGLITVDDQGQLKVAP
jgi:hypothetical protein